MNKIKNLWTGTPGYNCIACSPNNPIGFHLDFYEEGDYILTRWDPTQNHQSWINTLHGGVQSLLIDEVAGWVVTRKLQTTGVTSKMEIKYIKPVKTNEGEILVRAKLNKQMRNIAYIDAELLNKEGEVCTQGTLIYFCASPEMAAKEGFPGCEIE
ncbi:MAG: PaaI family thioesterase [Paludibacteraceae bacterium]|nr:PaaI family thioesterase [Paludibacteraceae bacterium]